MFVLVCVSQCLPMAQVKREVISAVNLRNEHHWVEELVKDKPVDSRKNKLGIFSNTTVYSIYNCYTQYTTNSLFIRNL